MARQPVRLTYEDYVHFPADRRLELIKGQPHPIPPPNRPSTGPHEVVRPHSLPGVEIDLAFVLRR